MINLTDPDGEQHFPAAEIMFLCFSHWTHLTESL